MKKTIFVISILLFLQKGFAVAQTDSKTPENPIFFSKELSVIRVKQSQSIAEQNKNNERPVFSKDLEIIHLPLSANRKKIEYKEYTFGKDLEKVFLPLTNKEDTKK